MEAASHALHRLGHGPADACQRGGDVPGAHDDRAVGLVRIDREITRYALEKLEIDELGLDNIDRRILKTIIKIYNGGPVGLETLAATIGEEAITIEDVYEPYLMQIGFLSRKTRGRCCTRLAYEHLGIKYNGAGSDNQVSAFDNEDE